MNCEAHQAWRVTCSFRDIDSNRRRHGRSLLLDGPACPIPFVALSKSVKDGFALEFCATPNG